LVRDSIPCSLWVCVCVCVYVFNAVKCVRWCVCVFSREVHCDLCAFVTCGCLRKGCTVKDLGILWNLPEGNVVCVCARVSLCVCVWQRGKETERGKEGELVHMSGSMSSLYVREVCMYACVCVCECECVSERERERERESET